MTDRKARINDLCNAMNDQAIETALGLLHPDVDWQDLMTPGRRQGLAAVRAYWEEVFGLVSPASSILETRSDGPDRIIVTFLHSIRDRQGKLWSEETTTQVFTFRDGLIVRMDLVERP